jgi:hypothetical protein
MNGLVVVCVEVAVEDDPDLPAWLIERITVSPSLIPYFISAFDPSIAPVATLTLCILSPDFTQTVTGFLAGWVPVIKSV